jgi:hypothetical protein
LNEARSKGRTPELVGYGLIIASIWLGWEILKAPVAERAPPAVAVRIAPGSPEVLRRAAEGELLADRVDAAAALAEESLLRAPFNARALRVRGLAAAQTDRNEEADDILTLAGNWSLRDDPTHAWLVENRLRRGDYASAFAHADTLVRRRQDLYPQVFNLFTAASLRDAKALQAVGRLLSTAPPWRRAYWSYLEKRPDGDALLLSLAVGLQRTANPLDQSELSSFYREWAKERRFVAMQTLRERIGRPSQAQLIVNGDFSTPIGKQITPFGWAFGANPGLAVEMTEDDLEPSNVGLRVDYDGYGSGIVASQFLLLPPGSYTLSLKTRLELASRTADMEWTITCIDSGVRLTQRRTSALPQSQNWQNASTSFAVPASACTAQRLVLRGRPSDRRAPMTIWFDDLQLHAGGGSA